MFLEKVKKTIQDHHMLEKGDFIVIGVSGGADSVALLAALCAFQKEYVFDIEVIHIHHGLRGEEADKDALFVKQLCQKCHVCTYFFFQNHLVGCTLAHGFLAPTAT